jgi:ABC-type glycerol-3-phosphate transport system permease component
MSKESIDGRKFHSGDSIIFDTLLGRVLRKTVIGVSGILLGFYILFPLYWMVVTAFKTTREIQQIPPTILPSSISVVGFEEVIYSSIQKGGYQNIVERLFGVNVTSAIDIDIFLLVFNSLKISILAGLIALIIGSIAAYAISRYEFSGKTIIMSLLLASLMFPGTAIMVPQWELINTLDLFNTHFAIVMIYAAMTSPFVVWLMKGFFDEFPASILEASRIDQCTPVETFRYVVIPMGKNSLIASFIFAFLLAWNELVFALTLLSGDIWL